MRLYMAQWGMDGTSVHPRWLLFVRLFSRVSNVRAVLDDDCGSALGGLAVRRPGHRAGQAVHGDRGHRSDHLLVEVRVAGLCAALLKGSLDGVDGVIAVRRELVGRGVVSSLVGSGEGNGLLILGIGRKRVSSITPSVAETLSAPIFSITPSRPSQPKKIAEMLALCAWVRM